jgi:hypothetical protein
MSSQGPRQIPEFFSLPPDSPIFTPQRDDYSCSVGTLVTVCNIYNQVASYDELRQVLVPNPQTGVDNVLLLTEIKTHLPVTASGESVYKGGVAIANIMQEGEGHYVVFLCQEKDKIAYYDPLHHRIVVDFKDNIEWVSEDRRHKNWSVDFAVIPGNSIKKWTEMAKC